MRVVTLTLVLATWIAVSIPLAFGIAWLTHASRNQRASTVPAAPGVLASDGLGGMAAGLTLPPTHLIQ